MGIPERLRNLIKPIENKAFLVAARARQVYPQQRNPGPLENPYETNAKPLRNPLRILGDFRKAPKPYKTIRKQRILGRREGATSDRQQRNPGPLENPYETNAEPLRISLRMLGNSCKAPEPYKTNRKQRIRGRREGATSVPAKEDPRKTSKSRNPL